MRDEDIINENMVVFKKVITESRLHHESVMEDKDRIDRIIELVRKRWKENSDMRLAQLIVNYARVSGWSNPDIFYLEDDKLEKVLMGDNDL